MRKTRLSLLAATGIIALAGLTGCAGGGQSTAEACQIAETEFASFQTEMQTATTEAMTDPTKAGEVFDQIGAKLDDVVGKISNEEVKPKLEAVRDGFNEMKEIFTGMADLDMTDQDAVADFSTKAQEISSTMMTAGEELSAVCPA